MIRRLAAIAFTTVREHLRRPSGIVVVVLVLVCVPVLSLSAEDADTQAWLSRSLTVEGIKTFLPLLAGIFGAFLIRPTLKHGWAALPVLKSEWFAGRAIGGIVLVALGGLLLVVGSWGGLLTQGDRGNLRKTTEPTELYIVRATDSGNVRVTPKPGKRLWLNPANREYLVAVLPETDGDLDMVVDYEVAWNQEAPPKNDTPFRAQTDEGKSIDIRSLGRRRAEIHQTGTITELHVVATDPSLLVGFHVSDIRVTQSQQTALGSFLWLLLCGLSAAMLCFGTAVLFRSQSSAATAALASVLVFSSLTLLPTLDSSSKMSRDRARDTQSVMDPENAKDALASLPELFPDRPFDRVRRGETTTTDLWDEVAIRLVVGLGLCTVGAVAFRRRDL